MSYRAKITSKLSSLDAARAIYFIVVGLAIKQSLLLFGHGWPPQNVTTAFDWWRWSDRLLVGAGYLFTVLRYTHGVSSLYAYEKERIEKSSLPSAVRVFWLSVFLTILGILFFLMADNIAAGFLTYLRFTFLMLTVDFLYIALSGVVRSPYNFFKRWKETVKGYAARAALQWMASDVILLILCIVLMLRAYSQEDHERLFALALIVAAGADYLMNREFYFGGKHERKKHKIVFVCSPLKGLEADGPVEERVRANIRRVQWYCRNLIETSLNKRKTVIPYASHCFLTYFLDDHNSTDRIIGRDCAVTFLSACDAIYVYVPYTEKRILKLLRIRKPDYSRLSEGMKHELDIAKRLGLEIRFYPQTEIGDLPDNHNPVWNPLDYVSGDGADEVHLDSTKTRKRVYVCTPLRGPGFYDLGDEGRKNRLTDNIKLALWYCHELVRENEDPIAPFAPQSFYPYFWPILDDEAREGDLWKAWFERSIGILTVCDAVYFYTVDGLPGENKLSNGMIRIKEAADSLGLEIQYRKLSDVPEKWNPAVPIF